MIPLVIFFGSCVGFDTIDDIADFSIADVSINIGIAAGEGTELDRYQLDVGSSATISFIDSRDPEGQRLLNGFLIWEVDNPEVLQIEEGTITTLSSGLAEVRALKQLDNGTTQEFGHWFFRVFSFQRIEVQTGETLNVVLGDSTQIQTSYYNSQNILQNDVEIELFSQDESILAVKSNGYVEGVRSGQTVLTLRVANIEQEVQTQISVMVEEDLNRPFSVVVENLSNSLELGDSTLLMGNAYSFSGRVIEEAVLIWESDDPEVIEITAQGYAKALKLGATGITASLEDGSITSDETIFEVTNLFQTRTGTIVSGRGGTTGTVELFVSRQDSLLYVKLNSDFFGARIPGPTLYLSNAENTVDGGLRVIDVEPGNGENRTFAIPGNPNISDFNYVIYHCEPFNIIYGSFKLEEE